jgi:hypothetical protein
MTTEKEAAKKWCSHYGCERPASPKAAKGLCNAHYHRYRRGTDMDKKIQNRGEGWISTHGYLYIGTRAYHRQVMENKLGRSLDFNEIVHHIDGDKTNNDISNLKVMDRGDHIRLHCKGVPNELRKKYPLGLAGKP